MLSPLALLYLLPVGGLITLLYLLKQKRRDQRVASLMLWEQVLSETSTASPFQKLRVDPLLLLQLLAVLLLCLALARPFLWGNTVGGRTVVLVVDASASMNAADVPGGRLQSAVAEAKKIIEKKDATDSVGIVVAGTQPVILSPLTADEGKLLAALGSVEPGDGAGATREALLLAGSLAQSRPDARVIFITDGAFARQDELSLGRAAFSTVTVGKRGANVGITAFDVREENGGDGLQAFVSVLNAHDAPRTIALSLRAGDTLVEARELVIPAGETRSVVVPFAITGAAQNAELLSARIESSDDLPADNEAFAALPARRAVRILLVAGTDDPFLERALSLTPRALVTRVAPSAFQAKAVADNDVTIWDSDTAPVAPLPPGRYLFFGAVPPGAASPVVSAPGKLDAPPVLDWNRASPVLRFANLSGIRIRAAQKVKPAPWASVLVESRSAPLMVAGETGKTRAVYVAFRPQQSDFPLRVAFPVFVTNAVSYLSAQTDTGDTRVLRPGDTVTLPPGATLKGANGATTTSRVGRYTVTAKDGTKTALGVSLLSAGESNTAPQNPPQVVVTTASGDAGTASKPRQSPQEWWQWLAAPLLLLLAAEWWVYFRRKR
ncbi:MAG: VWA domain-containing protein [Armatimonadetes bacterium]|nr:VWA domain-containing protein [Armatimonadota bacterium]